MADLPLPIRTQRLLLRTYRGDDINASLEYYAKPIVARYIPWEPWSREMAAEQVDKRINRTGITKPDSALALVVEHANAVIGDVVLWPTNETLSRGEMGWAFHPSTSGHGYATEAVRALIGVAFGHYGMHRVVAQLDARNEASAKLCERVGMTKEAQLRQDHWAKGEWTDNVIYGLLAEEWRAMSPGAQEAGHGTRSGPSIRMRTQDGRKTPYAADREFPDVGTHRHEEHHGLQD